MEVSLKPPLKIAAIEMIAALIPILVEVSSEFCHGPDLCTTSRHRYGRGHLQLRATVCAVLDRVWNDVVMTK
jgi:hypothetical protein